MSAAVKLYGVPAPAFPPSSPRMPLRLVPPAPPPMAPRIGRMLIGRTAARFIPYLGIALTAWELYDLYQQIFAGRSKHDSRYFQVIDNCGRQPGGNWGVAYGACTNSHIGTRPIVYGAHPTTNSLLNAKWYYWVDEPYPPNPNNFATMRPAFTLQLVAKPVGSPHVPAFYTGRGSVVPLFDPAVGFPAYPMPFPNPNSPYPDIWPYPEYWPPDPAFDPYPAPPPAREWWSPPTRTTPRSRPDRRQTPRPRVRPGTNPGRDVVPAPSPAPGPVLVPPVVEITHTPGSQPSPTPSPKPTYPGAVPLPGRPGPGTRERKFKGTWPAIAVLDALSEGAELVDCMYGAMPEVAKRAAAREAYSDQMKSMWREYERQAPKSKSDRAKFFQKYRPKWDPKWSDPIKDQAKARKPFDKYVPERFALENADLKALYIYDNIKGLTPEAMASALKCAVLNHFEDQVLGRGYGAKSDVQSGRTFRKLRSKR